jgi:hypothetical protein
MRKILSILIILLLNNLLGAATFKFIQDSIFTPRCAISGCHSGVTPQANLNLEAGLSYTNIVNIFSTQMPQLKLVNPNNHDTSYLYRKVIGVGITGARMPLTGDTLSSDLTDSLRFWIDEGALLPIVSHSNYFLKEYKLTNNYPNPFNPRTNFQFPNLRRLKYQFLMFLVKW